MSDQAASKEEPMSERTATCACGQLSITLVGEPDQIGICHCTECQRRTGSVFGVSAFFSESKLRAIEGNRTRYVRSAASGNMLGFDFCPTCGTTLFWESSGRPNVLGVAVGAFGDREFPAPRVAVWTERKHAWVEMPPGLTAHARSAV
jgi:hypothetical protein